LNKEEITFERLKQASLVIFSCPREMFSKAEFEALKQYLDFGGRLFFLLSEGGEAR
jgi:intraflagellar transport protein 52